jgi:anti-sigma regulatory factor (Ser/Thr protein kinase)
VSTRSPRERGAVGLVHEAQPYRTDAEFLEATVPYIRAALARDEPVLVEVPSPRGELVRDVLGSDAQRVRFGDVAKDGQNPARLIPWVLHPFTEARTDGQATIVVESMWPSRSAAEYAACVEHEALINLAFAQQNVSILCPYNLTELPEQALADAERTHPILREGLVGRISTSYTDPHVVVTDIASEQPATPSGAERFEFTRVVDARHAASEWGAKAGLAPERLTDLVIAISEVCGNTLAHAGDGGTVACWQDRGSLIYEIRDGGHIEDLLAGRLPPPAEQESGRGLLMVNLLCDLVRIQTSSSGTAIRLWMTLPTLSPAPSTRKPAAS